MIVTKDTVAICMATYNGECYLRDQIESILQQTYKDWVLFIRDDGSNDNSIEIIKEYASRKPEKIILIDDREDGGSPKKNFSIILNWVNSNYNFRYFMFSDQDDYWLETKVESSINIIKSEEKGYNGPILLHTDLKVVDSRLNIIEESFFKYRALDPKTKDINHLLVQNNITGCTMCWNSELNKLINLSDDSIVMHDWWIGLIASCFGKIICFEKPTILYRQHGQNVVGATQVNSIRFVISRVLGNAHVKETLKLSIDQSDAFLKEFGKKLSPDIKSDITRFSSIKNKNKINRVNTIIKHRYLKQGIIQIIGQVLFI